MKCTAYMRLSISLVFALLSSCKKEDKYCGVNNPIEDIEWLKQEAANRNYRVKIYELDYNSQQGFYIIYCLDSSCHIQTKGYKTCDNEAICSWGGIAPLICNDFEDKTTYMRLIYDN